MNNVKILSLKADHFGALKALELDFSKFKQGLIAVKGGSGQGKSTLQNAMKTSLQGRATLADAAQYGKEWATEIQLVDGDRKIFIEAQTNGDEIKYKLFEKDNEGKKVNSPVIDGVKATPAKYMELISTELTFGIKHFLSENATEHRKFMFSLFRPELEKLGVIFDARSPEYANSIMGKLDTATDKRDGLRAQCTHVGAFMTDFERDGLKKTDLELLQPIDLSQLSARKHNLIEQKGSVKSSLEAQFEREKTAIIEKANKVKDCIRAINETLSKEYSERKLKYDANKAVIDNATNEFHTVCNSFDNCSFLSQADKDNMRLIVSNAFNARSIAHPLEYPEAPAIVDFVDGRPIFTDKTPEVYKFERENYSLITNEYLQLKQGDEGDVLTKIETELLKLDAEIAEAEKNNALFKRFELNREWVAACGEVDKLREELAKLYAQIDTGVKGLKMLPIFDEKGKCEIKTHYDGSFAPEYFQNGNADDRLLVSYSSTQKPIIGVLLQVSRLNKKTKRLPYIFIDDVPMDATSRKIIAQIAEENDLTIITSITGDFEREKLQENELLINGGEVFFNFEA